MQNSDILPYELRFETIADTACSDLVEALTEYHDEQGSFVDPEFECSDPSILSYTDKLASLLCDGEAKILAEHVAYHAYFFAIVLAGNMAQTSVEAFKKSYESTLTGNETEDGIVDTTQNYLNARPSLDGLVGAFMFELDPTSEYPHIAETVAAFVLMHIELISCEAYVDAEVCRLLGQIAELENE